MIPTPVVALMRKGYIPATVLLGFGYSTSTVWSLFIGVSSGMVNLALKALVAALFLLSLPYMLKRAECIFGRIFPVILFLFLYSIRLVYDVVFRDIQLTGAQSQFYVLSYFFALTLLPVLSIAGAARAGDLAQIVKWSFVFLVLANASLIFFAFNSGIESLVLAFAGRLQADGSADGTAVLNPIGIGLMGACLAAFSMARIAVENRGSKWMTVVYLTALIAGIVNILLGASRGPAIAFAICALAVIASVLRAWFPRGGAPANAPAVFLIFGLVAASFGALRSSDTPIFLFERLESFLEGRAIGVGEERDLIRERALEDFQNAPVLGSSYVVSLENSLAHNIVIESLISVGALGFLVLVWALVNVVRSIWSMLSGNGGPNGYVLGLIGLCFAVIQLTSGSIGQTPEFWVFSAVIIVLSEQFKRVLQRNIENRDKDLRSVADGHDARVAACFPEKPTATVR